jgi:hypothetical protein
MFKLVSFLHNICRLLAAFSMLNNYEATPSGEKVFIRKPVNDFLSMSYDIFCITLTVFELFAENRFDGYRDAP